MAQDALEGRLRLVLLRRALPVGGSGRCVLGVGGHRPSDLPGAAGCWLEAVAARRRPGWHGRATTRDGPRRRQALPDGRCCGVVDQSGRRLHRARRRRAHHPRPPQIVVGEGGAAGRALGARQGGRGQRVQVHVKVVHPGIRRRGRRHLPPSYRGVTDAQWDGGGRPPPQAGDTRGTPTAGAWGGCHGRTRAPSAWTGGRQHPPAPHRRDRNVRALAANEGGSAKSGVAAARHGGMPHGAARRYAARTTNGAAAPAVGGRAVTGQ